MRQDQAVIRRHGDEIRSCLGGNKVRVITAIHYNRNRIYIRAVLTHEEYD